MAFAKLGVTFPWNHRGDLAESLLRDDQLDSESAEETRASVALNSMNESYHQIE